MKTQVINPTPLEKPTSLVTFEKSLDPPWNIIVELKHALTKSGQKLEYSVVVVSTVPSSLPFARLNGHTVKHYFFII